MFISTAHGIYLQGVPLLLIDGALTPISRFIICDNPSYQCIRPFIVLTPYNWLGSTLYLHLPHKDQLNYTPYLDQWFQIGKFWQRKNSPSSTIMQKFQTNFCRNQGLPCVHIFTQKKHGESPWGLLGPQPHRKKQSLEFCLCFHHLERTMLAFLRNSPFFKVKDYLGGGNSNMLYFHPENWGRWTKFDEHIFQMGWNHQLDYCLSQNHPLFYWWLKFLPRLYVSNLET